MSTNAGACERIEPLVQLRRNVKNAVVVVKQRNCLVPLRRCVECARWKLGGIYGASWYLPVNFLDRGVVRDPGFDPTIESHGDELIFFVGVPRRQRLKAVKDVPVANCPRN